MDRATKITTRAIGVLVLITSLLLSGCDNHEFERLEGSAVSWQSLRGEWVFINYWAIWCGPCREEIPELNAFTEGRVLGVNFDNPDRTTLQQHSDELNIEFTQLVRDPSSQLQFERPSVLPATYVFDPQGVYRGVMVGPQTQASLSAWRETGDLERGAP